jgi:hypothetical protein
MSIDNPNVIDFVGIDLDTGEVVLTISDHLPWDEEIEHFAMLEAKIRGYVAYVSSGQLLEWRPDSTSRRIRIDVVLLHPASPGALQFLTEAQEALDPYGISIRYSKIAEPN